MRRAVPAALRTKLLYLYSRSHAGEEIQDNVRKFVMLESSKMHGTNRRGCEIYYRQSRTTGSSHEGSWQRRLQKNVQLKIFSPLFPAHIFAICPCKKSPRSIVSCKATLQAGKHSLHPCSFANALILLANHIISGGWHLSCYGLCNSAMGSVRLTSQAITQKFIMLRANLAVIAISHKVRGGSSWRDRDREIRRVLVWRGSV